MFLFNKRTRNIIKYMWAFFAILIILSMVIAYSGFASLTQAPPSQPIEIPEEVQMQLNAQKAGLDFEGGASTPEEQEVLRAIEEGRIDINSGEAQEEGETQETSAPPAQELKLEI